MHKYKDKQANVFNGGPYNIVVLGILSFHYKINDEN